MSFHNICEFGQNWWAEARKKVKNAVVFLDPVVCECLHWNGGAPSLLEAGATSIKELSSFEVVPSNMKKGVFISSTAWYGTSYKILENLIRNSNLEYCVIITSAHVSVHNLLLVGNREGNELEAFDKIEEDVLNWMGNLNYTVEIFSYPLSTLHPTRETVLIPSAKSAEPFLPSYLGYLNEQLLLFSKAEVPTVRSVNDLTFSHLPQESQVQIRQLVHNLNQLIQHMNGKEEIFTLGSYSRIVGTELEALNAAKTRRKTATNKISVIVVDRILDLASATKCSSENSFDRLIHTLKRLHEYSNDVAISLTANNVAGDLAVAPGCIAPQTDWNDGWKKMDCLFYENSQDAKELFTDELRDALGESTSRDNLMDVLNRCKDWDFIEKYTPLYQIASALSQTQHNVEALRMNNLEGIRKTLVESLDSDSPSPLMQILQLLRGRNDSKLSLEDILLLLVHLYSLAGEDQEQLFPAELEDRLQSLLAEIFVNECDNLSEKLQDFIGTPVDEVKAHRAAQKIVEQLHYISGARCHLKRYRTLYQRRNSMMPMECSSFLHQLINDIFDPSLGDNPDLEHKSGSLKDFIKTGFSLFVNVRKPRPADNSIIILYVCGGIRPDEVKLVRELCRQKSPSHKVLIVSSHFISAYDTLHYIFNKNGLA